MHACLAVPDIDAATDGEVPAGGGMDVQSLALDAELVLSFTGDRQVTLHAVTLHGHRELGTFDHVRDAWAAIDRIDIRS